MKSRIPTLIFGALLLLVSYIVKDNLTGPQVLQVVAILAIFSAVHPFGDN